jgi:hypothetical protein
MKRSSGRHRIRGRKRSSAPLSLKTDSSDPEYRVGPGRPPKEYQFKPAKVAILKARAENRGQLHPTSRLCSNVRSVER